MSKNFVEPSKYRIFAHMNTDYCFPRRIFEWIRRFRNRCGYNIHSPFAFNWVTGVVYCDEAYYAYESLAAEREEMDGLLSEKDDCLLFRLANHQEANHILYVGQHSARPEAYLRAARKGASFNVTNKLPSLADALRKQDMVVIEAPFEERLSPNDPIFSLESRPRESGIVVCHGIHRNRAARERWKALCHSQAVTVTFDLYRFGIAFLRPKLNRQHYRINYF